MDIFEMGEEIAAQHRAQAARDDADPAYQAALKAKRAEWRVSAEGEWITGQALDELLDAALGPAAK